MSLKAVKKTVKEFTLEEKAKSLNAEIQKTLELEQNEVIESVNKILTEKGYALSARMILEAGKETQVQPFIYKLKK